MEKNQIQEVLSRLKDDEIPSYFSLKKSDQEEDPEFFIDANRNGVLAFCDILLKSLERSDSKDEFVNNVPDDFYADDSDTWITHINVANGKRTPMVEHDSIITQFGCFASLIAIAIVFLVGVIKSLDWIGELIKYFLK